MMLNNFDRCQREYDARTPDDPYECPDCGAMEGDEHDEDCSYFESSYCPDCKTVNGCSCDEQYQAYKERSL